MLKVGTLVKRPGRNEEGDVGVIIDTYPPTVYDNRLYIIQWQHRGVITLEEEKNLHTINDEK